MGLLALRCISYVMKNNMMFARSIGFLFFFLLCFGTIMFKVVKE